MSRDELLQLDDSELLKLCRFDSFRGVGPGGQKRNKTESAVRVTHIESGLSAFDDTSRSQHTNKHNALKKLRMELALNLRESPTFWQDGIPSVHSTAYPRWIGIVTDSLFSTDFKVSDSAAFLGLSTAKLVKELQNCPEAWQYINSQREQRGLQKLKVNK